MYSWFIRVSITYEIDSRKLLNSFLQFVHVELNAE